MEETDTSSQQSFWAPSPGPIRWAMIATVALIAGAFFLLVARGIPWASSGLVSPTLMGREIKPPESVDWLLSFGVSLIHMVVALLYGFIIGPIVHWLRGVPAIFIGGLIGLLLYLLNYAFFNFAFTLPDQRELPALVTHLAFGMIMAGGYKGVARRDLPLYGGRPASSP